MRLIKSVSVSGFRSIRTQTLDGVGGLTALVGRNSSGKSNLLRALNLFFNNEPEPGKGVSFSRDHHNRPQSRKKKRISVSVGFELPTNFNFRKGLESLKAALGTDFIITRIWELDQAKLPFDHFQVVRQGNVIDSGDQVARDFLHLIGYRYIPNRTVPAAVLRDESQEISRALSSRVRRDTSATDLVNSLQRAAESLLRKATQSFSSTGAPLDTPKMSTPSNLGELLTVTGFEAVGAHGGTVRDEDWGAGHQAFFLYEVLHTVDTSYSQFFGWRQATIWGVEEPESGLHHDLEAMLAGNFRGWSEDQRSKLQILTTTHSPVFTMAADSGYWSDVQDGETVFDPIEIAALVRKAQTAGVSSWTQPILAHPWNTIVLVEGDIDKRVLQHVASLSGITDFLFFTLRDLDPAESAIGKDAIKGYLRKHGGLIANRPVNAPLIVLLDWDVSSQDLAAFKKAYGARADEFVCRMNPDNCDKKMGPDFRGIERFYPSDLVLAAHRAGEFNMGTQEPYSISSSELKKAKKALLKRVLRIKKTARLSGLVNEIRSLRQAIDAATAATGGG